MTKNAAPASAGQLAMPTAKRRGQGIVLDLRDIGAQSARWTLLILLGEFASDRPVWSSTLLKAASLLGFEEGNTRRALLRIADRQQISSTKIGRSVQWSLTEEGAAFLTEGQRRLAQFQGFSENWDGQWLLLSISIPDAQKGTRYALRSKLTWLGLGSAYPSQWMTPHTERAVEVERVIKELDAAEHGYSFVGKFGSVGDQATLVRQAWDLDDLGGRYAEFVTRFGGGTPASRGEAFVTFVQMLQAYRRFPFIDPSLPRTLLPDRWPGFEAVTLFQEKYAALGSMSREYWEDHVACHEHGTGLMR